MADTGKEQAIADPLPQWQEFFADFMALDLFNIPVWRLSVAVSLVLLGLLLRVWGLKRLMRPFSSIAQRTTTDLDEKLLRVSARPLGWTINILAFYAATMVLELPEGLEAVLLLLWQTAGTVVIAWLFYDGVDVLAQGLDRFADVTDTEMDDHLVPLIRKVLRVVVVVTAMVTIVQTWGYDVTSLVAGLGLGGLAFALAAKDTLSNWFGSVMIFTDRPFSLGDWVKTKHGEGVVEEIGLRSTKIRTFGKSLISVPNADMASTSVENFSEMTMRRIKLNIGLGCDTDHAQIQQILGELRAYLRDSEDFDQDSWLVHFTGYGASTLDLLLACFTKTTAYAEFLQIQEALLFHIGEVVERAGSTLAYPSQSIYIETPLKLDGEPWQVERSRESAQGSSDSDWYEASALTSPDPGRMQEIERDLRAEEDDGEDPGAEDGDAASLAEPGQEPVNSPSTED